MWINRQRYDDLVKRLYSFEAEVTRLARCHDLKILLEDEDPAMLPTKFMTLGDVPSNRYSSVVEVVTELAKRAGLRWKAGKPSMIVDARPPLSLTTRRRRK